jgi:hypothetical protein
MAKAASGVSGRSEELLRGLLYVMVGRKEWGKRWFCRVLSKTRLLLTPNLNSSHWLDVRDRKST